MVAVTTTTAIGPNGSPIPPGTTVVRGVAPNSMQILQSQVNHIRQQFPNLSVPECQQLLSVLPVHLKEMQSRDNAGRNEYLQTLNAKEKQVVTYFHMRRHHCLLYTSDAADE